jgi:2-hydroxy-3-oxopropionate reductase
MDSVGFVGLGIMGRPMAENLARGCLVLGLDTRRERLEGLAGVRAARSMQDMAASRVVCLSLPTAEVAREVAIGAGGLVEVLASGSLVIDLGTGVPSLSRSVAQQLAVRGIDFVDAPVSGGEAGAKAAALAIMAGASPLVFERALPYLKLMGGSVVRVGDVGAGGVAKLVNNMIVAAAFGAVAEGFALARHNGVEIADLYEALRGGWAGSKVLDVSARDVIAGEYRPGGTVDMLLKDLSYARQLAAQGGVPLPMTSAASKLLAEAQAAGYGGRSQPVLFELWSAAGGQP